MMNSTPGTGLTYYVTACYAALAVRLDIGSTSDFLAAVLIGFAFNVLAGLRADSVSFVHRRLCNFNGHKFKDSLIELFLVVVITYLLQLIGVLVEYSEGALIITKWLFRIAVIFYIINGLRNLNKAYPKSRFVEALYIIVTAQFLKIAPDIMKDAFKKTDKNISRDEKK